MVFLIAIVLLFIMPIEEGTFLYSVFANLIYLLELLFTLQGITFIFYFAYQRGVRTAWAVRNFVHFIKSFNTVTRILGIIDLGFDLRKRVQNKR